MDDLARELRLEHQAREPYTPELTYEELALLWRLVGRCPAGDPHVINTYNKLAALL